MELYEFYVRWCLVIPFLNLNLMYVPQDSDTVLLLCEKFVCVLVTIFCKRLRRLSTSNMTTSLYNEHFKCSFLNEKLCNLYLFIFNSAYI